MAERIREHRSDLPSSDEVESRHRDGWRLAAVEWERDAAAQHAAGRTTLHEIPYGLKSSADGRFLEEDPDEAAILRRILAGLVDDRPLSEITRELNAEGLRSRAGRPWRQSDLFDLLPRIVEAGAEILRSDAWAQERRLRAV